MLFRDARMPLVAVALLIAAPAAAHEWNDWLDCDRATRHDRNLRVCEERTASWKADGSTIRADAGPNGGVSVRGVNGNEVKVTAVIHVRAKTDAAAQELARRINVVMERGRIAASGPETAKGESWAVSFLIEAPKKSNLDVRAHNGPIDVTGIHGTMDLQTHNGPLALDAVAGSVKGRTRNGPLAVTLTGTSWQGGGLDAETRNGPVSLRIPSNYSATLESGSMNGPWSVDLPGDIRPGRHFTTRLGKGGANVRVVSMNGPLSIARR